MLRPSAISASTSRSRWLNDSSTSLPGDGPRRSASIRRAATRGCSTASPARGLAQRLGERVGVDVLEQARQRTGLDRGDDLLRILERRQQHDLRRGAQRADAARRLDAAARHDEIDQRDVRMVLQAKLRGAVGVLGFADDRKIRMRLEERADALADEHVVVGDDDADHGG